MPVDRFLGAGWASVHGPSDPRGMILWALDHGFQGLLPAPAPRPVDWRRLQNSIESLPFRLAAVRVSALQEVEAPAEAGLGSLRDGDQQLAFVAVSNAVGLARELGSDTVILDPGHVTPPLVGLGGDAGGADSPDPRSDLTDRGIGWDENAVQTAWSRRQQGLDPALENLCRSLHRLCKSFPDMTFCLSLSRSIRGLGEPQALAAAFEDLSRYRLGYWHDTVAAACRERFLGEAPGNVLELCSKMIFGMTLGDFSGEESYLPPGAGGVDYPLLSAYRQPSTSRFPVVIELEPGVDPGEIPGIHAYLDKFGL